VIIEQTPEGPKKHVFYGDVKMVGQDGQAKTLSPSKKVDDAIQKEQEEIEKFIEAKKERLKQLQIKKLKST